MIELQTKDPMPQRIEYFTAARHWRMPAPIRRQRMIYLAGVLLLWSALVKTASCRPGTTNLLAPGKAECDMAFGVIGGVALTWLLLGLPRIIASRWLWSDWVVWAAVVANLVAALSSL